MPLDIPGQSDLSAPSPAWGIQLKGPAEIQPALPLAVTPRQLCTGRGGGSLLLIPYDTVGTDGLSWGSYAASSVREQRGVIIHRFRGKFGPQKGLSCSGSAWGTFVFEVKLIYSIVC